MKGLTYVSVSCQVYLMTQLYIWYARPIISFESEKDYSEKGTCMKHNLYLFGNYICMKHNLYLARQ